MRLFRWTFALVAVFILISGVTMCAATGNDEKDKEETRALIQEVAPMNVRPGDTVVASGLNLGKKWVLDLYITNGTDDVKVEVTEQTDKQITFKVPANLTGRYRLMIMTNTVEPKFIEQPVRILVE
jgi:hypothetical protein